VAMDASDYGFGSYRPASIDVPWVPSACNGVNHAVTVVGSKQINGVTHLIVRNSWGTWWGASGYFSVSALNSCSITTYGWGPVVKKEDINPDPNPNPIPTCPTFFSNCNTNDKVLNKCDGIPDAELAMGSKIAGWQPTGDIQSFTFFKEKNCNGSSVTYFGSFRCFEPTLGAVYSSAASNTAGPKDGCITLYESSCFGGASVEVCNHLSIISATDINIKKIGSLKAKVTAGVQSVKYVVIFDDYNYRGNAKTVAIPSNGKQMNLLTNADFSTAFAKARSIILVKG